MNKEQIKKINDHHRNVMQSLFESIMTPKKQFRFETIDEAEEYYEDHVNSNSNNMNVEFENARDAWLEDNADDIRESYEENHPNE